MFKKILRHLRDERGQALLIVLGIASVVMILMMALMSSTDAEVKNSKSNQAKQNLTWVARSSRNIVEECFNQYIWGPLASGIENKDRVDEGTVLDALLDDDPLYVVECALGITRQETNAIRFYIDLSDPDGVVLDDLASGQVIRNELDDERAFIAQIRLEPGGPAHISEDNSTYVFPLNFEARVRNEVAVQQTSVNSGFSRDTSVAHGNLTMYIRRGSFCIYTLFMERTSGVILTGADYIEGDVHTNGSWEFMQNPGTVITGRATQTNRYAYFHYNNRKYSVEGSQYPPNETNPSKIRVKPTFGRGFYRNVPKISLPVDLSEFREGVLGGGSAPSSRGVYLPVKDGAIVPGKGIYIKDNASIELTQGNLSQTYVIKQSDTTYNYIYTITTNYATENTAATTTYSYEKRRKSNNKLEDSSGPTTYAGTFKVGGENRGPENAIYVNGSITGINGQLDENTSLSICAYGQVTVNGNITLEKPEDTTAPHRFGLLSESSNVVLDLGAGNNNPPRYIDIHGSIMTPNGKFEVCSTLRNKYIYPYDTNNPQDKAKVRIFGGIISKELGATESGKYGYGTFWQHDKRLLFDPPPLFPKLESVKMSTDAPSGQSTLQWIWIND